MRERLTETLEIDQIIGQILINPQFDLGVSNIKPEYYVDMGYDSIVVLFDGFIYKLYGKGYGPNKFGKQQLSFYKETTNQAKELAVSNKYRVRDLVNNKSYKLIINPFLEILSSESYGVFVGKMPYVGGPKLGEIFTNPSCEVMLKNFSEKICEQLNVTGVDLTGFNTKIINSSLVVTDLCTRIPFLVKVHERES